ncbi:hypothetical protein QZJ86_04690 [Methylomonas montana]|uniref:hypothetical protein n=1 Tax=Methylomonas montana TaxID=3058963 RepID=UPI00265A3CAB|nr:hypothetical protein [Methylomonas montana]WKJ91434.1 hypothetical protein QZJ86_04690 [Methylomonas montana]
MSKIVPFPSILKLQLKKIAEERGYPVVSAVVERGEAEELVLNSEDEAQALVNVARIEMLDASLKYPFWNDDLPNYDPKHEDAFQDIQMGIFEKTVMYLSQEFKIVSTV